MWRPSWRLDFFGPGKLRPLVRKWKRPAAATAGRLLFVYSARMAAPRADGTMTC
jgi:hypothetical protein